MSKDKKPPVEERVSRENFRESVKTRDEWKREVMPSQPHPKEPPSDRDPPSKK